MYLGFFLDISSPYSHMYLQLRVHRIYSINLVPVACWVLVLIQILEQKRPVALLQTTALNDLDQQKDHTNYNQQEMYLNRESTVY